MRRCARLTRLLQRLPRNARLFFPAIALCSAMAAHAQSTGTVTGTVMDASTHRGIARALVESSTSGNAQLTDGAGHFSLSGLAPGTVQLRYRRPGYFDPITGQPFGSRTVTLSAGTTDVTLALEPSATLRGQVVTPNGDSPAGIRVDLYNARVSGGWRTWQGERSAVVHADGTFFFGDLPPGSYAVHTQASLDPVPEGDTPGARSGYAPVFAPSATDLSSATVAVLEPGQTAEVDPVVARVPFYPVTIHVAGSFIGYDARITGNGFARWSPRESRENDSVSTELPSGSYRLHMFGFGAGGHNGAADLPFEVDDAPATTLSTTLSATAGMPFDTQIDTTGDASSSAATEDSAATSGAAASQPRISYLLFVPVHDAAEMPRTVFVRRDSSSGAEYLETAQLHAGQYWIKASAGGGYVAALSSGDTDLFTQPLSFDPASPPSIAAVLRSDSATITVALSGPLTQQPCVVHLVPLSPGGTAALREDTTGTPSVTFSGLAPGDYLVLATETGAGIAYREPGVVQQLTGEHVSAAAGATAQATLSSFVTLPASAVVQQ